MYENYKKSVKVLWISALVNNKNKRNLIGQTKKESRVKLPDSTLFFNA